MSQPCSQERVIAAVSSNVSNLIDWQKAQNGSLQRTEGKVDVLKDEVHSYKQQMSGHVNKILAGISVTCILLVVDILIRITKKEM